MPPDAVPPGAGAPSLRFEPRRVAGWGMAVGGEAHVLAPRDQEELAAALRHADEHQRPIALRGSGCSYGDAALNTGHLLLDLRRLDRLLAFDPERGIARVEPGVTIRALWRHAVAHGFWPAVVPGTMEVSVGGAAAMNVHGKNNFAVGSFGEHVRSFELLLPSGELLHCSRERNADVFHAAIGGFGMLGCFTELELQLKRVYSGRLRVTAFATDDLDANLELMQAQSADADYLVGWLDLHARGSRLGRGLVHRADQLQPGEDPEGERMLAPELQDVPPRLFGVVPKGWLWPGLWAIVHARGIRWLNAGKYVSGVREAKRPAYLQTHGAFHFLLDYVPNWKRAFAPGGLIQFQPFLPASSAATVLRRLIASCHTAGLLPYLGVLKRHRPDPFLMTHALDGWSLAMDFAVTAANRARLWAHCQRMADDVLAAGGRFYYAKDATLQGHAFERVHGKAAAAEFRALKRRLDPRGVLQSDLSRRLGL